MAGKIHTDLALEAREIWQEGAGKTTELPGVRARERAHGGCRITTVEVLSEAGAKALDKPMGTYVTLELDSLLRRSSNAFVDAAGELALVLSDLGNSI